MALKRCESSGATVDLARVGGIVKKSILAIKN